jgi:hypothetical protein
MVDQAGMTLYPNWDPVPHVRGRKTNKEYDPLFQNSPKPKWAFDAENLCLLDENPAAVKPYEYSREEFLVLCLPDLTVGQLLPAGRKVTGAKTSKRNRFTGLAGHRCKDGSTLSVPMICCSPLPICATRWIFPMVTMKSRMERVIHAA